MDVRVLIVDDQPIARSGLTCLVNSMPGYTVVAEAGDGSQALARARENNVGLVLMDLRMPRIDGVEATRRLMRTSRPPRVIVMTAFAVDERALLSLDAGALGFLMKDVRPEELRRAMDSVMSGGSLVTEDMLGYLVAKASRRTAPDQARRCQLLTLLSDSEREVLAMLGAGMSNAQIASVLYLSVSSVKTKVSRLLQKLELDNRTQAAVLAHEFNLSAR
ncbi:response regulator [Streptomyces sp. NPDC055709]